jgi:hypothetical protein
MLTAPKQIFVPTLTERRSYPRIQPEGLLTCQLRLKDQSINAWVQNLSAKSIALLLDRSLPINARLRLVLINEQATFRLDLDIHIIRCSRLVTGDWFVAALFERILTTDELRPFLA